VGFAAGQRSCGAALNADLELLEVEVAALVAVLDRAAQDVTHDGALSRTGGSEQPRPLGHAARGGGARDV
jgi:hypothetical protein